MNTAKSVNANFTAVAAGTLVITVKGKGTVSAPAGKCIGTASTKTCIQKYTAGRTVTLTASAAAGNTFAGWGDACVASAKKLTCTLSLSVGRSVSASFLPASTGGGGGGGGVTKATLTSFGRPIVTPHVGGLSGHAPVQLEPRGSRSRRRASRGPRRRQGDVPDRRGPGAGRPVHRQAPGPLHLPGRASAPRCSSGGCASAAAARRRPHSRSS